MSAIDHNKKKLSEITEVSCHDLASALTWLARRDKYVNIKRQGNPEDIENYIDEMIDMCNKNIIKILNL